MILAFVGKGGVGKTTIASATALSLSEKGRTVLVSSDFMSSLRYLFPTDPKNLEIMNLNEKDVAQKWKDRFGEEVATVLKEFVDIDDWILDHVASSPGVAEEFLLSELLDLYRSGKYEYIVWDTAASSSTMHLLLLEREFYAHLDRDVRIYLRIKDRFRSKKILRLLEEWKKLANDVWKTILSAKFFLVTTSDELSIEQSSYIDSDLKSMGIEITAKICNRCSDSPGNNFQLTIPELSGKAIDIVHEIRDGKIRKLLEESDYLSS